MSYDFNIILELKIEDADTCNGCKFISTGFGNDYCRLYDKPLKGRWESCAGPDYFALTRLDECKEQEAKK